MTDTTDTTTDGLTATEIEADTNATTAESWDQLMDHAAALAAPAPYLSLKKATVKLLSSTLITAGLDNTGLKPALYERAVKAGLITDQKPADTKGAPPETKAEPAGDEPVGVVVPESYTVVDEPSYIEVAEKFNIANFRELAAFNGVYNSRYELNPGDVVRLLAPKRG